MLQALLTFIIASPGFLAGIDVFAEPLNVANSEVLAAPSFLVGMKGLTESIQVSDELVLISEYAPENSTLKKEAMLLSVEDFAVLQAEVESSLSACNTRLEDLSAKHRETIDAMQRRCEERHFTLKSELKDSQALNKQLSSELASSESSVRWHKWLNIGLALGVGITLTMAISN